jgi:flagellar motility protein MotE (MotC chaperone)
MTQPIDELWSCSGTPTQYMPLPEPRDANTLTNEPNPTPYLQRIADLESIVKQICEISSIEAKIARQDEKRIAALQKRAKAQSIDNNKALAEVATLKERVALLEDAMRRQTGEWRAQRGVNETLLSMSKSSHPQSRYSEPPLTKR